MADRRAERRLAAILAADIVGFSRLMEADEQGTLLALRELRRTLVDPSIAAHHGRVVKTAGDSALVEFPSVVDAVSCAVEVQTAMQARRTGVPAERQILFRIGINVGDVVVEDGDIFGDGVNVAARLQAVSDPGGILISAAVREGITGRLNLEQDDAGELTLKNISRPIRAFRVRVDGAQALSASVARATAPRTAVTEPPPVIDRPSIAVLPFTNMSADPAQEFFADGLVEDLTTLLARLPAFFVIARNSSFTYKNRSIDIREVGRELGVRYVVEGSIQKAGNRIRVNAQLIEGTSGKHVWAERYDRDVSDLFIIQDEITQGIFAALQPHLYAAEADYARRKAPENVDAWGLAVQAQVKWSDIRRENVREVESLARRALALQPDYGLAHALLAQALGFGSYLRLAEDFMSMGREAYREAKIATDLAGDDPEVMLAVGNCLYFLGLFAKSNAALEHAVELNQNSAHACGAGGFLLGIMGRPEEGIEQIQRGMRLSPRDPQLFLFHNWLCFCHLVADQPVQAVTCGERAVRARPRFIEGWVYLAAALAAAGRTADAAYAVAKAREIVPELRLAIYKQPRSDGTTWGKLVDGLRLAGLPE